MLSKFVVPTELTIMASEFRAKLSNMKRRRMEEIQSDRADRLCVRQDNMLGIPRGNGNCNSKLHNSCLSMLNNFCDFINLFF